MDRLISIGLGAVGVIALICLVRSCECKTCGAKRYAPSPPVASCESGWATEFAGVRKDGVAWKIKPC